MWSCAQEKLISAAFLSHPPSAPCPNWLCHDRGKCQNWKNVFIGKKPRNVDNLVCFWWLIYKPYLGFEKPKIFILKIMWLFKTNKKGANTGDCTTLMKYLFCSYTKACYMIFWCIMQAIWNLISYNNCLCIKFLHGFGTVYFFLEGFSL